MAAPPITERHKPHFHKAAPVKESVRAATTANITIATALNNADTLDGVTLATGDRVLVKDQSTGSQNGIYVVGASPARDYDLSTDDPAFGYLVYVREGTANAGTTWGNTNTSAPTVGTTALTFAASGGSGAPTTADYLVGTSQAGLSAEIVVGTSPGGELGGTWASPTVDATHSGSAHIALSTATPLVESGSGAAGSGTAASKDDHVHPAASGGSGTVTTVEEVDGSPTDSAVTKIVFPNGSLAIASHVATVTFPTGGGGADTLLGVYVASASATVPCVTRNATGQSGAIFQSDFDDYEIVMQNVIPASDGVGLQMTVSTDGGSTYLAGTTYGWYMNRYNAAAGSAAAQASGGGTASIPIDGFASGLAGNTTSYGGVCGVARFINPLNSAGAKSMYVDDAYRALDGSPLRIVGEATVQSSSAVNAIKFAMSAGNITSGRFLIYGKAKT